MNKFISREERARLKREVYSLSRDIEDALRSKGLVGAYKERPAYQRNDYIGWIERAKQQETRTRRINQMLVELKKRNVYMKMKYTVR